MEKKRKEITMLKDQKIVDYIELIDSTQPTPGGGSVNGLVGACGNALVRMYGHLSIHKKSFLSLDPSKQTQFLNNFEQILELQKKMLFNLDQDALVYEKLMASFQMKKATEEEKKQRQIAIQEATLEAISPPMEIMRDGIQALYLCQDMIETGNKMVLSDLAIGVIYLACAIEASSYNVMINLKTLNQQEAIHLEMSHLLQEANQLKTNILNKINQRMGESYD